MISFCNKLTYTASRPHNCKWLPGAGYGGGSSRSIRASPGSHPTRNRAAGDTGHPSRSVSLWWAVARPGGGSEGRSGWERVMAEQGRAVASWSLALLWPHCSRGWQPQGLTLGLGPGWVGKPQEWSGTGSAGRASALWAQSLCTAEESLAPSSSFPSIKYL